MTCRRRSQGDQIDGCTAAQARTAMRRARTDPRAGARRPRRRLGAVAEPAEPAQPGAAEGRVRAASSSATASGSTPEHVEVCERLIPSVDGWYADRRPPLGLVHGDYRLDNLLFGRGGCHVVDWQTVGWGPALLDASYFLGNGLTGRGPPRA